MWISQFLIFFIFKRTSANDLTSPSQISKHLTLPLHKLYRPHPVCLSPIAWLHPTDIPFLRDHILHLMLYSHTGLLPGPPEAAIQQWQGSQLSPDLQHQCKLQFPHQLLFQHLLLTPHTNTDLLCQRILSYICIH